MLLYDFVSKGKTYIIYCKFISAIVIAEPDDVTVCEGEEAVFTCVLNKNSNIDSDDVQWYGLIMDTGVTEMVNQDRDNITLLTHTGNTMNSSLTITNIRKSHAGLEHHLLLSAMLLSLY